MIGKPGTNTGRYSLKSLSKKAFQRHLYKAANWIWVGTTKGRGKADRLAGSETSPKGNPYLSSLSGLQKNLGLMFTPVLAMEQVNAYDFCWAISYS
jgi:hypothetical protein